MISEPTIITYHSAPHSKDPWIQVAVYDGTVFCTGTHYEQGSLGIFIPDGWILPDYMIEEMLLRPYLKGPEHNRVKRSKMKGIWSEGVYQGIVTDGIPCSFWNYNWCEGDYVAEQLGIEKWINPEYIEPLNKEE